MYPGTTGSCILVGAPVDRSCLTFYIGGNYLCDYNYLFIEQVNNARAGPAPYNPYQSGSQGPVGNNSSPSYGFRF